MISISQVVWVVVYIVVGGLIFYLLKYLVDYINPPEPWKKVANVVLAVFAILVLISVLLSLIGATPVFRI